MAHYSNLIGAFAFGFALLSATACGTTTQFTPTNPSPRAMQPKAPEQVHVYTSTMPEVPFTEVGIIQARQSSELSLDQMPEIIQKMRKDAAKIGCDGVILNGTNNKTVGHHDRHGGSTSTLEGYWGTCIVYQEG